LGPGESGVSAERSLAGSDADQEAFHFVSFVLDDVQKTWATKFRGSGHAYEMASLVVFTGRTDTACGLGSSATGPFYCPRDHKVYIDLGFYGSLRDRLGAGGDFAQAYVIAHEIGHHVQNQLGTMREFDQAAARMDERRRNALTVRLELQADCYAGVWGFYAAKRNLLEPGDLEEGMRAAAAVGDDTIQKRTQGYTVPDAFTHGRSEQRTRWFRTGFQSGDPRSCNTFAAKDI
jgi:predicted metalloprotease